MNLRTLSRGLLAAFGLGHVTATRDDAPVKVLQVRFSPLETHDSIPLIQQYGFSSRPKPNANAVVVFLTGDRNQGLAIATTDQRYVVHLSEGEVALHTDEGDHVYLKRGREIEVVAGTKLTVTSPLTTVSGDLRVAGGVTAGYGGSDAVTLQGHSHKQGTDTHGDTEQPTDAPTAGT